MEESTQRNSRVCSFFLHSTSLSVINSKKRSKYVRSQQWNQTEGVLVLCPQSHSRKTSQTGHSTRLLETFTNDKKLKESKAMHHFCTSRCVNVCYAQNVYNMCYIYPLCLAPSEWMAIDTKEHLRPHRTYGNNEQHATTLALLMQTCYTVHEVHKSSINTLWLKS